MRRSSRTIAIAFLPLLALAACGGSPTEGEDSAACGALPFFTILPVALEDFSMATVVGGLGAPGHTLPTAHSGFYLTTEGAAVITPGDLQVRELRRVTYLVSPSRQGHTDYALNFRVCRDVEGWFGHLTTLTSPILDGASWGNCQTYSTSDETIENCFATSRVRLAAGEPMGTGGLSIELGLMGLDFGLLDYRVNHFYVPP